MRKIQCSYAVGMAESWIADTSKEALEVYTGLVRDMGESRRIARIFELSQLQRSLQEAAVLEQYPDEGENGIRLRVAARLLSRDEMIRVYGWDPQGQ